MSIICVWTESDKGFGFRFGSEFMMMKSIILRYEIQNDCSTQWFVGGEYLVVESTLGTFS